MVVLIDTLRADHLGAYGYDRPTSPNFDALARDSVVFDRTTAQAAWTKPSVASLMTGVFVHKHGVVSSRDALAGPPTPGRGACASAATAPRHFRPIRGSPRSSASIAASTSSRAGARWGPAHQPLQARCAAPTACPHRSTCRVGVLGHERQPQQLRARSAADRRRDRLDRGAGAKRSLLPLRPPDRAA